MPQGALPIRLILRFLHGTLAERLRQWIANPSFSNGWVGSTPTCSATLFLYTVT